MNNSAKHLLKKPRDRFELFLDLHNHKLELVRTITSCIAAFCTVAILVLRALGKF